jgi:hypothetical protein
VHVIGWLVQVSTVGRTLNGVWLAIAAVALMAAGLVVAWPFWFGRNAQIGTILGAGTITVGMLALIVHEFVGLKHLRAVCTSQEIGCHTRPDDFTRYAIYAGIGFLCIFVLFIGGLRFEERRRDRWRL